MKKIIEKIRNNKKKSTSIIAVLTVLVLAGIVWASTNPQAWDTGYRLWNSNRLVFFKYGNNNVPPTATNFCSIAKNTSALSYFVPTKTGNEFWSFKTKPPSGVSTCCEFSTCVNYGLAGATLDILSNGIAGDGIYGIVNCPERPGCCPVFESDSALNNEQGLLFCVREGPNSDNYPAGTCAGWSSTCEVKGEINCNVGNTCDCECRRKDGMLFCGDWTANTPQRVCRVRDALTPYGASANKTPAYPLGDWPASELVNPTW